MKMKAIVFTRFPFYVAFAHCVYGMLASGSTEGGGTWVYGFLTVPSVHQHVDTLRQCTEVLCVAPTPCAQPETTGPEI